MIFVILAFAQKEAQELPSLAMTKSWLLKMAIEIVGLPIEHGDFP